MNNFVKLYPKKNRLINMVTEYYITIGDFEKIINNDFALLETKWLNDINYFPREYNLE